MSKVDFQQHAQQLIAEFAQSRPIRANNLLVTVFGDTVCPYGGTLWLGSLIKLVEPLGVNQRLVRTSVFRLTEQKILTASQQGRRSFYTLTERGFRQFNHAARRIYAAQSPTWDGYWRMVITSLGNLSQPQRDTLRRELTWMGYSRLTMGLYVHPMADPEAVRLMLEDQEIADQVVILEARDSDHQHERVSIDLLQQSFVSAERDQQYREFIDNFAPILQATQSDKSLDEQLCFLLRTLLIHRYRHILLNTPELPDILITEDAPSLRARKLAGELYQRLSPAADRYFSQHAECVHGKLPEQPAAYYQRFNADNT